eukprot:TRINITY_DN8085_c0_g1_i1.p1 TRINITY_DN8085_c0_g1~~TRINITY_DN8085_c0_g1_i1.p1  ORF type:complete len:183 (+),score=42.10 TRINITY_DN8085_c0_g1_i1:31-549(+)
MSSLSTEEIASIFQLTGAALSVGLSTLGTAIATGSLGSQILSPSATVNTMEVDCHMQKSAYQTPGAPKMKKMTLVVMAGILAIYGLIMAIIIVQSNDLTVTSGIAKFAAGLAVGGACLSSGYGMSRLKLSSDESSFIPTILIMIFLESLAVYGLIVGFILNNSTLPSDTTNF